jgi:hypothetical protein
VPPNKWKKKKKSALGCFDCPFVATQQRRANMRDHDFQVCGHADIAQFILNWSGEKANPAERKNSGPASGDSFVRRYCTPAEKLSQLKEFYLQPRQLS